METIKDILESVKRQILDRLGNPLVGAFVIAWVLFNFRMVVVFLGDGTVAKKLELLDGPGFPHLWSSEWWWRNGWGPGAMALTYVISSPWVSLLVNGYTLRAGKVQLQDEKKQSTAAASLMSKEAGAELIAQLAEKETEHAQQRQDASAARAALQQIISELKNSVARSELKLDEHKLATKDYVQRFGSPNDHADVAPDIVARLKLVPDGASTHRLTRMHIEILNDLSDSEIRTHPVSLSGLSPSFGSVVVQLMNDGLIDTYAGSSSLKVSPRGAMLLDLLRRSRRSTWAAPMVVRSTSETGVKP